MFTVVITPANAPALKSWISDISLLVSVCCNHFPRAHPVKNSALRGVILISGAAIPL